MKHHGRKICGALLWRCVPLVFFLAFTSCSTVKVRTLHGKLTRESIESARELRMLDEDAYKNEEVEEIAIDCLSLLRDARRYEWRGQTGRAAGCYLHSALYARNELAATHLELDTRKKLLELHNFSLARFVEYWIGNGRAGGNDGDTFYCGDVRFDVSTGAGSYYEDDYFDNVVSTVSVKGRGVVKKRRDGIGASLVGVRHQSPERAEEMEYFFRRGLHVPVSAVIENVTDSSGGRSVAISFLNPLVTTSYEYGGFDYAVAADFSSPVEMLASGENELILGLAGFFLAAVQIEESGIFLAEPYDPNRIPVVLTHGLFSSPMIWRDIIPHMSAEDDLSEKYQFMLFAYPSSLTIPESARLFRECLADLRAKYDPEGNDPLSKNMIGVGHSMGGVLTHLLVADMGDHLWNQFSDVPFSQFEFPPGGVKEDARSLTYFAPDPAVRRAVYYSTPHGGAELAELNAANVVSRLAKLPSGFLDVTTTVFEMPFQKDLGVTLGKKMTSIQSLQPDSPIVEALNQAPYKPGVVYHSIIGDRGKNDTPNSSDGVVEYWSSHQKGAESELIVPTGHRSYEDQKAIEELERILRLHAGLTEG